MSSKTRRAIALSIPLVSAAVFWGWFGLSGPMNLAQTGVSLGLVIGLINVYLWYMIYKRQIP